MPSRVQRGRKYPKKECVRVCAHKSVYVCVCTCMCLRGKDGDGMLMPFDASERACVHGRACMRMPNKGEKTTHLNVRYGEAAARRERRMRRAGMRRMNMDYQDEDSIIFCPFPLISLSQ